MDGQHLRGQNKIRGSPIATPMDTATNIMPQKGKRKLARRERLNAAIDALNRLLGAKGANGIKVHVTEGNVVIDAEDLLRRVTAEKLTMTVCKLEGTTASLVERTFWVDPE